ncbi:MAG: hypothetical protein D6739_03395 [Nitrospirae bacterium]|nr:MAG: hypothetical protein D6739_03395 [Nitrospirota bacterium]
MRLEAARGRPPRLTLEPEGPGAARPVGRAALGERLEVAIPLAPLGLARGDTFHLSFALADGPRLPLDGPVELTVPDAADYRLHAWMA